MRITILQGAFLPVPALRGGAIEKAWEALGQQFSREGHEVTHISRLCDGLPRKEKIGFVQHIRVKGADAVQNPLVLKILEFVYVWRARKVLPRADILITHAFWAPILYSQTKHGKIYVHVGRYPKGQFRFYSKASRFQVPSSAIAEAVIKELPLARKKISILPYPLYWEIPDSPSFETRKKIILYLGRIHPEKGILELLKAWGKLTSGEKDGWVIRIRGPWKKEHGGGGKEYKNYLLKKNDSSSEGVEIMEPIFDYREIINELTDASIFVYPSLAEKGETFGLAILEAMSLGCVPLTSSLSCFDELNIRENGFVFDHEASDKILELKDILKRVISGTPKLPSLSESSQEHARAFELHRVADRFLVDFQNVVND